MLSIKIQPITNSDQQNLLPILREIIKAGDTYPYNPDSSDQDLLKIWLAPSHNIYVAILDNKIIGTYYIRTNQPHLGAHICNAGFMVMAEYAGKGIGTKLGKHALKEAKSLGYKAMQFNLVVETNLASIRIWKKFGFDIIGSVPKAFKHPTKGLINAHIMYKEL